MSQFKNFDIHIDAAGTSARAVWEVSISTPTGGTPPNDVPTAGDTIEWGATGFTVGTGRGTGIVTSYSTVTGKLRFYRTNHLPPETEGQQINAFPIAGDQIRETPFSARWTATITAIAKKNASGFQINPPWFIGTTPTPRTQKALTSTGGDYLFVDSPLAMNQNRTINQSNLGVDSFVIAAWGATAVVDAPAVITYQDGITYRQGLILPNAGDRMLPEILNRNFAILDRTLWRFEGAMIEMGGTQTLTAGAAPVKLNFNTLVYEDLPLFGFSAGTIADYATNFRLKVLPHWSRVAVFAMLFAAEAGSGTEYLTGIIGKNGGYASYTGRPVGTSAAPAALAATSPPGLTLFGMPPHTVGGTDTFEVYAAVTHGSVVIQAKSYFGIVALKYAGQFP